MSLLVELAFSKWMASRLVPDWSTPPTAGAVLALSVME
jgi:hypothetical protein